MPAKTSSSSAPGTSGSDIRWRDGWISSIGRKPAGRRRRPVPGRGRDLGVGRDDVDALGREPARRSRPGGRRGSPSSPAPRGDRAARDVRAAAADQRPRPAEDQRRMAVVGDEVARPPARRRAVLGPGARLVDVAARRRRPSVASQSASSSGVASRTVTVTRRAPNAAAVAVRRRSPRPPPRDPRRGCGPARLVGLSPERVEHEIPRADVADLAAAEPGLEVGDAAGREAPQVVARGALLARACGWPPT